MDWRDVRAYGTRVREGAASVCLSRADAHVCDNQHACMVTQIMICSCTCTCRNIHSFMHICIYLYMLMCSYTHIQANMCACTNADVGMHIYVYIRTHAHPPCIHADTRASFRAPKRRFVAATWAPSTASPSLSMTRLYSRVQVQTGDTDA